MDEMEGERQQLYQQLYQELWISFSALLRSYAAATSLALPAGALKLADREGCGLQFCTASKVLDIAFHSQSGSGQWSVQSRNASTMTSSGSFAIDELGRVSGLASGSSMEMDVAAETLTAMIL